MKTKVRILITIIVLLITAGILAGPIMSDVEKPKYKVIAEFDNIEVREYEPMIIAEVIIEGTREESIGKGFRILADYIFGNNISSEKIPMTSPVQQQPSVKIAMTAPVQQQKNNDSWLISFVMPSEYSLNNLPEPKNKKVQLSSINAETYVAIKFSGRNRQENINKHQYLLKDFIEENKMIVEGTAKYAFYNPPWTLPFLRRNEIMYQINDLKSE